MGAAEEIAKFHELLKSNAITQEDYEHAKSQILGNLALNQPPNSNALQADSQTNHFTTPSPQPTTQSRHSGASPLQTGAAVAAGVVGGRLLADRLLNNDETITTLDASLFGDGTTLAVNFVEMPNGDVFYQLSETVSYDGVLTQQDITQLDQDFDNGDSVFSDQDNSGFADFF